MPPPNPPPGAPRPTRLQRLRRLVLGKPRDVEDTRVFHQVSLVAFLAWVGLGADGLSSSSYGPEEAFKALGEHTFLAAALAIATAFTVIIISASYRRIIEHFPYGGGGYVVASRLLGAPAGVVSGSALIVDYVLTITISVAAGTAAIFSFLPESAQELKLPVDFAAIALLTLLNLRGVKESVKALMPIFIGFIVTHAVLIGGVIATRAWELGAVYTEVRQGFAAGVASLGTWGVLSLFFRAYSMGAGTYTGIEAVSNGLPIMREPRVETGKRTMALMAASLAITAGGIILAYLLMRVRFEPYRTMNAVLASRFADGFQPGGVHVGHGFVLLTLATEALLLFVAAQTGFIDGPRVMANMANDAYFPRRFVQLSDRLTMRNGVLLMGTTSALALLYTGGDLTHLVVMYSINVFITFSLSQAGMCRYWVRERARQPDWVRHLLIHAVTLLLCVSILAITVAVKFEHGGWVTLAFTSALIGVCFAIHRHYGWVRHNLRRLDEILAALPEEPKEPPALQPKKPTAVLFVGPFAGLGVHSLLNIVRTFPGHFANFVFLSVGVVDSATFTDVDEVRAVRERTQKSLDQYVKLARRMGLAAEARFDMGTDPVEGALPLCHQLAKDYPRLLFFAGKLVFQNEHWYDRFLHNETAYQLQRRLMFEGMTTMVLPVRVLQETAAAGRRDTAPARTSA